MSRTIIGIAVALLVSLANHVAAQPIILTIGQTGINPGTGPLLIAQNDNHFAKYALEVKLSETQTTAAVQTMLGGSMMHLTLGAGAASSTATLPGAPPSIDTTPIDQRVKEGHFKF